MIDCHLHMTEIGYVTQGRWSKPDRGACRDARHVRGTQTIHNDAKRQSDEQNAVWISKLAKARRVAARSLRRRTDLWVHQQQVRDDRTNVAIDGIRSVEKAYIEQMGLQAPVEYWKGEAEKHKTSARKLFWALLGFFVAAVVILGAAFCTAGYIILNTEAAAGHPAAPVALYVVISGALASLSTIAFWIGRLLTKMYLSENHLQQDADERAVMTTTYLALIRDKAATDEERKIILSALFRSTADGIVKDEGPGDLTGIAALVSSLATKH